MREPFRDPYQQIRLDRIKVAIAQRVSREVAEAMRLDVGLADSVTQDLIYNVTVGLLADELPPNQLTDTVTFPVQRFASWWEMFLATYRQRWWGRLLRLRQPRFIDEPTRHTTTVKIRSRWVYPQATRVLPADDWGHVVMKADTSRISVLDLLADPWGSS